MTTDTETQIAKVIPVSDEEKPANTPTTESADQVADRFADDEEDGDIFGASTADEDDPDDDFAFLELFDKKCLGCSHLVPFAPKKYKGCHFSNGNIHCPAAATKIVVRIPLDLIVPKFITAEEQGDNARLARLHATLAKQEPWYQERVNEALKDARKARDSQSS